MPADVVCACWCACPSWGIRGLAEALDGEPEHAAYVLKGIKFLDDRFATPTYILLLLTGFGLVYVGDKPLTTGRPG